MEVSESAEDTAASIKSYYSYWWENQRDIRAPVFSKLNDEVLRMLQGNAGSRALDLGSGKGTIVRILRSLGYAVTAVDFNPEFTRQLKDSIPDVDVICADLRSWTPETSYDVATCIEVAQVLTHRELDRKSTR